MFSVRKVALSDGREGPAGGQRRHEIGDRLHHEPQARRRAEPPLVAQRTNRSSRFASLLIGFSAQHSRAGCSAEFLAPARWGGGPLE